MSELVFSPTEDFFSDEFRSQYIKGLTYNVRDDKLFQAVDGWISEGKVVVVGAVNAAQVSGTGEVI